MVLLDPGELLGLRHGEDQLGIAVHQRVALAQVRATLRTVSRRATARPSRCARGRPPPGCGGRPPLGPRGAPPPGRRRRRPADVAGGGGGQSLRDAGPPLGPPRPPARPPPRKLTEHLEVSDQVADVGIDEGQLGLTKDVDRLRCGRRDVPGDRANQCLKSRVRGRLDENLDVCRIRLDREPAVEGMEALDRRAVGPVHQTLGSEARQSARETEVDHAFDELSGPVAGDSAGQLEPGGPPRRPPAVADVSLGVGRKQRIRHRDRFAGNVPPADRERYRRRVDRGHQALVQHA